LETLQQLQRYKSQSPVHTVCSIREPIKIVQTDFVVIGRIAQNNVRYRERKNGVRFEFFTAVDMKNAVSWI
jgi:predicted metal-dependent RNase